MGIEGLKLMLMMIIGRISPGQSLADAMVNSPKVADLEVKGRRTKNAPTRIPLWEKILILIILSVIMILIILGALFFHVI